MIFALSLGLALLQGQVDDNLVFPGRNVKDTSGFLTDGTGAYWVHGIPSDDPHLSPPRFGTSPKVALKFYYHTDAYVFENGNRNAMKLRFRVFSQTPDRNREMGKAVALELLVLWRLDHDRLGTDHKASVNSGVVDVYLCEGTPPDTSPGGEQAFKTIPEGNGFANLNSIYVYDCEHFDDRMEQAREVAHEYGHAVLTPVGGFEVKKENVPEFEYWANGFLGEKLFLRWGRDAIIKKQLQELDFMSTPLVRMDYWVKQKVDPLVRAAAERPPDSPLLSGKSKAAFDAFQGIVLWCDSILPPKMFARTLKLIGSTEAKDYAPGAVLAAEEASYSPLVPDYLKETARTSGVWVPVGNGSVTGGTPLKRSRVGGKSSSPEPLRFMQNRRRLS